MSNSHYHIKPSEQGSDQILTILLELSDLLPRPLSLIQNQAKTLTALEILSVINVETALLHGFQHILAAFVMVFVTSDPRNTDLSMNIFTPFIEYYVQFHLAITELWSLILKLPPELSTTVKPSKSLIALAKELSITLLPTRRDRDSGENLEQVEPPQFIHPEFYYVLPFVTTPVQLQALQNVINPRLVANVQPFFRSDTSENERETVLDEGNTEILSYLNQHPSAAMNPQSQPTQTPPASLQTQPTTRSHTRQFREDFVTLITIPAPVLLIAGLLVSSHSCRDTVRNGPLSFATSTTRAQHMSIRHTFNLAQASSQPSNSFHFSPNTIYFETDSEELSLILNYSTRQFHFFSALSLLCDKISPSIVKQPIQTEMEILPVIRDQIEDVIKDANHVLFLYFQSHAGFTPFKDSKTVSNAISLTPQPKQSSILYKLKGPPKQDISNVHPLLSLFTKFSLIDTISVFPWLNPLQSYFGQQQQQQQPKVFGVPTIHTATQQLSILTLFLFLSDDLHTILKDTLSLELMKNVMNHVARLLCWIASIQYADVKNELQNQSYSPSIEQSKKVLAGFVVDAILELLTSPVRSEAHLRAIQDTNRVMKERITHYLRTGRIS